MDRKNHGNTGFGERAANSCKKVKSISKRDKTRAASIRKQPSDTGKTSLALYSSASVTLCQSFYFTLSCKVEITAD